MTHEFWRGIGKLVEEMGEVAQLLGKLIPFPDGNHPDGKGQLRERLEDEIADLYAALDYFVSENKLDFAKISFRTDEKLNRFKNWHLSCIALQYKYTQGE